MATRSSRFQAPNAPQVRSWVVTSPALRIELEGLITVSRPSGEHFQSVLTLRLLGDRRVTSDLHADVVLAEAHLVSRAAVRVAGIGLVTAAAAIATTDGSAFASVRNRATAAWRGHQPRGGVGRWRGRHRGQ